MSQSIGERHREQQTNLHATKKHGIFEKIKVCLKNEKVKNSVPKSYHF